MEGEDRKIDRQWFCTFERRDKNGCNVEKEGTDNGCTVEKKRQKMVVLWKRRGRKWL